ncbi:MAG: NADPH-dependent FMN reductase [Verrucomicrobiota bacterium]
MIIILSGSNREGSVTGKCARQVQSIYNELGAETKLLDLANLPLEIFSPSAYAEKPPAFEEAFASPVLEADGLVVLTPEYNGSFPGALKYFIDMLKFPESFEARPVCFIGLAAGEWGGLRPVEQLQQVFGYRNAHIFPKRVFINNIYKKSDDEGLTDEAVLERIEKQASAFLEFTKNVSSRAI